MKKIILFIFIAIATLSVKAQGVYTGGSLGVWHNDDADRTSITIAPEVGYNFNEKWSLGVALDYTHETLKITDSKKATINKFAIAPYVRYSYFEKGIVRLFLDGGFGIATVKYGDSKSNENGFNVGITPGLSIKLAEHFNFITKVGFLGYQEDYFEEGSAFGFKLSSENLTFGFHYEF